MLRSLPRLSGIVDGDHLRSIALASATSKTRRRLIPFLFLLYIVAYLDRVNVGFAALQMNEALGFSARTYGLDRASSS